MTQQYQFFNRDLLEEACNLRLTGSRTASIGRRNGSHKRSQKRSALRHGRGDGYEMIDGILHKQSDNWRMPNLRGYPGAKMARKAAQGKIGKRA